MKALEPGYLSPLAAFGCPAGATLALGCFSELGGLQGVRA